MNPTESGAGKTIETFLDTTDDDDVYVVNPNNTLAATVIQTLGNLTDPPATHILAPKSVFSTLTDDFVLASSAAEHVDTGRLTLNTTDDLQGMALISATTMIAVIDVNGTLTAVETEFDGDVTHLSERASSATQYTLRTPPANDIYTTLADDIGEDTRADFETLVEQTDFTDDNTDVDEVTLALLAAAKNRELLYDISKWGEDVGVASKATFSRTKTKLEDLGFITTEKVPIDVGRPRLRLELGPTISDDATATDIAATAADSL